MDRSILEKGLIDLGLTPSSKQLNQFHLFYEALIEWNGKMNLTSITAYEEVVIKHFLDSINVVRCFDLSKVQSLIDVGTGAGFPGIPIKIMFPHIQVTLLDALNKRVQFMNEIINGLSLKGIEATHERAEILAKEDIHREIYDVAVSRAVSNLATLSEYCIPFVKVGGYFIAYKSSQTDDEIIDSVNALEILGGKVLTIEESSIIGTDLLRRYIIIKKIIETPIKYPRKAGLPSKRPL